MAFGRRKKVENKKAVVEEVKNEEIKKEEEILANDSTTDVEETKNEEIKTTEEPKERKLSIKKGVKVIADGRCFGSQNLECPLKTVRNYETKILEISEKSVLIDEGWISKENIK